MGVYTNGKETLRVEYDSCTSIDLTQESTQDYQEFPTLEELNKYLENTLKAEKLYMPEKVTDTNKWYVFRLEGVSKAFSQKQPNGHTKSVTVQSYTDGEYLVYLWENNYDCDFCLIKDCINFVEDLGKNPKTDLEVDMYTMNEHGASGMDGIWRFPTLAEADKFLTEKFGISQATLTQGGEV